VTPGTGPPNLARKKGSETSEFEGSSASGFSSQLTAYVQQLVQELDGTSIYLLQDMKEQSACSKLALHTVVGRSDNHYCSSVIP